MDESMRTPSCFQCEMAQKIAQDYKELNKLMAEKNHKLEKQLREIKRHLRVIKRSFLDMMDVDSMGGE